MICLSFYWFEEGKLNIFFFFFSYFFQQKFATQTEANSDRIGDNLIIKNFPDMIVEARIKNDLDHLYRRSNHVSQGGGSSSITEFLNNFQGTMEKLLLSRPDTSPEKGKWNLAKRNIRKHVFSSVKSLDCSIDPILLQMLNFLATEIPEALKVLVVDLILDIQELLKASICKGVTKVSLQCANFSSNLSDVYNKCQSVLLKLKLTQLKICMYDCLTYIEGKRENVTMPEVAYVIKNCCEDICEELFKIMKRDSSLFGIIVSDFHEERTYGVFSSDFKDVVFFNGAGIVLEMQVTDIHLLQRKELYYISHKGKYSLGQMYSSGHFFGYVHYFLILYCICMLFVYIVHKYNLYNLF